MKQDGPVGFQTMSSGLKDADNYHRWLYHLVAPHLGRRVLECGAGNGIMTAYLASSPVERVWAVDIDPLCLEPLRERLDPGRVTLEAFDIASEAFSEAFAGRGIDTVVIVNVLEHMADDSATLRALARVLVPSGRLLVFVPAFPCLFGGMDRAAGHHRRYTRRSLAAGLREAGFMPRRVRYVNPLGFLGWWVTNRLMRVQDLDAPVVNSQISLFDRFGLPVSRLLQPLTSMWLGQSVFAVASREERKG